MVIQTGKYSSTHEVAQLQRNKKIGRRNEKYDKEDVGISNGEHRRRKKKIE